MRDMGKLGILTTGAKHAIKLSFKPIVLLQMHANKQESKHNAILKYSYLGLCEHIVNVY